MKYFILLLLLSSCYSQRKAEIQFGKAVTTYPVIGADWAKTAYPIKERLLPGKTDTLQTFDTLYGAGTIDTLITRDTVTITKTVTKLIHDTRTINVHDTLIQENTAALSACEARQAAVIDTQASDRRDLDAWKSKAKTRFWWILALLIIISGYITGRITKKIP